MSAKRLTAAEVVERMKRVANRRRGDDGRKAYERGIDSGLLLAAELAEQHLIETPEQSRERFERWRLSQDDTAAAMARRHADGSYQDVALRLMWTTWEASRTFRSEQES